MTKETSAACKEIITRLNQANALAETLAEKRLDVSCEWDLIRAATDFMLKIIPQCQNLDNARTVARNYRPINEYIIALYSRINTATKMINAYAKQECLK